MSAASFVAEAQVHSIRYESPLEIVLWIAGGYKASTYVVDRILDLWIKYQAARRVTARTNYEIEALRLLQEQLNPPTGLTPLDPTADRLGKAAALLAQISELEVLESES